MFQTYNLIVLSAALALYLVSGLLSWDAWWPLLWAVPGTVIGSWVGARVYQGLSDQRFHVTVLCLLAISGATLIWSFLFGK